MARRSDVIVQTKLRVDDRTSPALIRMARLARSAASAARGIGTAIGGIGIAATLATGAVAGIGVALTRISGITADRADEFAKLSRQVDVSAQTLQNLEFVAGRQGASFENVTSGIEAFTKRIGEAREGTGALYTFLGRSDEAFLNQLVAIEDNEEALGVFLQRLSEIESASDQAAAAAAAFGRSAGADFIRVLDGGAENFRSLMAAGAGIRPAFTDEVLRNAEQYADNMFDAGEALKSIRDELGAGLIPLISNAAAAFTEWVIANREFITQNIDTIIASVARFLSDTDWQGVAVNAASFASSIASINWSAVVVAMSELAANIDKVATALVGVIAVLTGASMVSALANLRTLTAGGAAAAGGGGRGRLLSRLNPIAAVGAAGLGVHSIANAREQARLNEGIVSPSREASLIPAFRATNGGPDAARFSQMIAQELQGSLDVNVNMRVSGGGEVESVGTVSNTSLVGNVGTNLPAGSRARRDGR